MTDVISVMSRQSRFMSGVCLSYSCFEKGCPTKAYATMLKDIMGNRGSWSLIEAFNDIEQNSTNKCI